MNLGKTQLIRLGSKTAFVRLDCHPCFAEDAVAGLSLTLRKLLPELLLPAKRDWLFAMSATINDVKLDPVEQDSQQTIATIREAQSGSSSAFGKLVAQHQQSIGTQMRRFARDSRTCEELTHDVFVEAYFSLASFRFNAPFLHWLRRIAVRVGYRYWKTQKRQANNLPITECRANEFASGLSTDSLNASEAAELVHWLLSQLSLPDRLVLTTVYLDGCSIKEAAFRCCWTVAGTKLRLFRARKKMLALLDRYES